VVKDKETRRKLAGGREWAAGAPFMIVGLVDRRIQASYYYNDMGITFEHLVLAAADMDLMRRKEEVKQLLGVPEDLEVIVQTPLGQPSEGPTPRDRRPLKQIASWEKYGHMHP
jgi:hypothetical protein